MTSWTLSSDIHTDVGEHPTVIAEAWARLLKPLGTVFGDNFYEPGYAAYCGVIQFAELRHFDVVGESRSATRGFRRMYGQPTAMLGDPRSIFDVFALVKDGVNRRLFDR
jgi:hypothetical protein